MSVEDLRTRIAERLDPADSWDPAGLPGHSDFDLNPQFRPTDPPLLRDAAVLIPIIDRPEGLSVILTRRSDTMTSHSGQIAFPGGRLDEGEEPVGAALREAWEEIGLERSFVDPLGLSTRYETVTGYVVTPVVGLVRPGFALQANPSEVAEVFETPFAFLMDPANHKRESYERNGERRWFYAMPWEDRYIWGATAGMLRALWNRLYGDGEEAIAISSAAVRGLT
jgi:8-oxo-dGTP pyrophosphatase MutT (NUDIX family)